MTWKFHVLATAERRLFSPILIPFAGVVSESRVSIEFVCSSEDDHGYRIEALLYRPEKVRDGVVSIRIVAISQAGSGRDSCRSPTDGCSEC
jgi:hypothetical protein